MTRATFIAQDPHRRTADEGELKGLLDDIRGIKHWSIDAQGQVTVEYDHQQTSSNVIEEALAGIGYRVKHLHDDARLGKADRPNYGVENRGGGNTYGD